MYDTYVRQKDSQLLFEFPKNYAEKKYFIGLTVASGPDHGGLQAGDFYVQWRQYNNRLALIAPNWKSEHVKGDTESKDSVDTTLHRLGVTGLADPDDVASWWTSHRR